MRSSNTILLAILSILMTTIIPLSHGQNSTQDKQFLDDHNAARAAVGVRLKPMAWDRKLARLAQFHVDKCIMAYDKLSYNYSNIIGMRIGQNLFVKSSSDFLPRDSVRSWNVEKVNYHYQSNKCDRGKVCGHYTQVVWRSSVRLGCAISKRKCPLGMYVVACNYFPPGNILGQRPY